MFKTSIGYLTKIDLKNAQKSRNLMSWILSLKLRGKAGKFLTSPMYTGTFMELICAHLVVLSTVGWVNQFKGYCENGQQWKENRIYKSKTSYTGTLHHQLPLWNFWSTFGTSKHWNHWWIGHGHNIVLNNERNNRGHAHGHRTNIFTTVLLSRPTI